MTTPDADPAASTLAGWRETEQAATPGPWEAGGIGGDDIWADAKPGFVGETSNSPADARFIAEARTAMPRLLKALEAVLKLADDWDAESDECDDHAADPRWDEEAKPILEGEAIAYHNCASELREVITAALTGTQPGEDGDHDR